MLLGYWFELLEHALFRVKPRCRTRCVQSYIFLVRRGKGRFVKTICWLLRDAAKMIWKFSNLHGAIAQLGERIVRNDEVVGSIPTSSTILLNHLAPSRCPSRSRKRLDFERNWNVLWHLAGAYHLYRFGDCPTVACRHMLRVNVHRGRQTLMAHLRPCSDVEC
jgi:hypothetical protein